MRGRPAGPEPEWVDRAREMQREGKSIPGIASLLGVTTNQVDYRLNKEKRLASNNRKATFECIDCGREFERRALRLGSGKCEACAQRMRPLRVVECIGCGETFETRDREKKYCTHRCYLDHGAGLTDEARELSAVVGRKRKGAANPNFRHGRRINEHERRLVREFNLEKKGERVCRVCACEKSDAMQAHHAVPRSISRAGKYDLRNCLPLCAVCHTSWHRRSLTIYRDIFTEREWDFISSLATASWLDERYPDRNRPFREEGLERVPVEDRCAGASKTSTGGGRC